MDLILQSQSSECGLACLAMVASHHGQHSRLGELRQRFAVSIKGASLGKLIEIARHLGMSARALRLDMDGLDALQTPCILHWDLNHFVVLARLSRGKATIHDPAQGKVVLDVAEVSRHFTGVALEVTPDAAFEPRDHAAPIRMRELTGQVSGLWSALATILATRFATGHLNDLTLSLHGTRGALRVETDGTKSALKGCLGKDVDLNRWKKIELEPVRRNARRFADALASGENGDPSFRRAADIQRLIDAVVESDRRKRTVAVG